MRAERMGCFAVGAAVVGTNPLYIARVKRKSRYDTGRLYRQTPERGSIRFAAEQPENGKTTRVTGFIWRSNLLGSSGKAMSTC